MEAAFFDLDKTIVARSSALALGPSLYREGLISRSWWLRALYAQLMLQLMGVDEEAMERMRRAAARLTEGWEERRVRQVVHEVLERVMTPLVYADALTLIREHQSVDRIVCIVSSSPEEIVEPLARMVGADRWIASKARIVDGRYTGDLDFYAFGRHKAEAVIALATAQGIDLARSFAYSDSITDLPLLEAVGHPVVVNPRRELRRLATARGWRVESFRHPVPMGRRLPHSRRRGTVAIGVAAMGGVAGVATLARWLTRRTP